MRVFREKATRSGAARGAGSDSIPAPSSGQRETIRLALNGGRVQPKADLSTPGGAGEGSGVQLDGAASSAVDAVRSGGQPLSPSARSYFEPRFGRDFSDVRVHADSGAAETSRALHAQAFTYRNHIAFAAGRYVPDTIPGRKLLAHELTHVVQQGTGGSWQVRRAPDDPAPTVSPAPAPPGPAVSSSQPAAPLDPDAQEALMHDAIRGLTGVSQPTVDHVAKSVEDNESAAAWNVLMAFGGEAGVNAAFDTLSAEVRKQVDEDSSTDFRKANPTADPKRDPAAQAAALSMQTQNRIQFFIRMRLYFPSWSAMLEHFRNIEEVSDGDVDLFLHKDAAARFRRAITVLKAKGKTLPKVHGGFQLRHLYVGGFQHPGYMVHAMGYAFDASAKSNPKISMNSPQATGVERNVQTLIAALPTVGPERARMALDPPGGRPGNPTDQMKFIVDMGKRTANDLTSAHDDTDPAAIAYFRTFDQQFQQMTQGSVAFKNSLSPTHRDALLRLRDDYFKELKVIQTEKSKGARADPSVIAAHQATRLQLLGTIPSLVTEWLTALDQAVAKEIAKHAGMDQLRSPSVITQDLTANSAALRTAEANARQGAGAVAQAQSGRDAAKAALQSARQQLDRARRQPPAAPACVPTGGKDWSVQGACKPTVDPVQAAQKKVADAVALFDQKNEALIDALDAASKARTAVTSATRARDTLKDQLSKSDLPALKGAWRWVDQLTEMKNLLANPDLSTPAGVRSYERLTTGDLSELGINSAADNPPLVRLLDLGFFNPTSTFDQDFFEEVTHSGFQPGASWQFGGVDSMHFELTEGRLSIQSPGTFPAK